MSTTLYDNLFALLGPTQTRADSPGDFHTAHGDIQLVNKTQFLYRHGCGTRRTWVWPSPEAAPTAVITAVDTETAFVFQDSDNQDKAVKLPWLSQQGFNTVAVALGLCTRDTTQSFAATVQFDDFASPTTASLATMRTPVERGKLNWSMWHIDSANSSPWRLHVAHARVDVGTVNASKITLDPVAVLFSATGTDPYVQGTTSYGFEVKLAYVRADDYLKGQI